MWDVVVFVLEGLIFIVMGCRCGRSSEAWVVRSRGSLRGEPSW